MLDKLHFFLNVIVYFLNFGAIICILFIACVDYEYFELIDKVFFNWNKPKIETIRIINIHNECLTDKKEETFLFDTNNDNNITEISQFYYYYRQVIPFVNGWCECNKNDNFTEIISGNCIKEEIERSCLNIDNVDKYILSPTFEIDYKLCVTKNENFNYTSSFLTQIIPKEKINDTQNISLIDSVGNGIKKLPHNVSFKRGDDSSIRLINVIENFGTQYIGFKYKCQKLFNSLFDIQHYIHNLQEIKYLYVFIIMFVLFFCLFFLILMREIIYYGFLGDLYLITLHIVFMSWFIVLSISDYCTLLKLIKLVEQIINMNCSDKNTMVIFIGLLNDFLYLEYFLFRTLLLFWIMMFLSFVKLGVITSKALKRIIMYYMGNVFRIDQIELELEMITL